PRATPCRKQTRFTRSVSSCLVNHTARRGELGNTVHRLRQEGLSRLRDLDLSSDVPIRYFRDHLGGLFHVDTKALGRIPAGRGHRSTRGGSSRPSPIGKAPHVLRSC